MNGVGAEPSGPHEPTEPAQPAEPPEPITDAASARRRCAALQQRLAQAGVVLRLPPAEPTTCCGRGCNGCVWEAYFGAVGYWVEDAEHALLKRCAGLAERSR